MAVTQSIETIAAKLSAIPVLAGQVIYVRDTQELYFDSLNGTRVRESDVVWLDGDSERTALVSPSEKLYYIRGTGALWAYSGGWVNLSAAAPRYVKNIPASDWTGTAAPYTHSVPAATHGKGVNPTVRCVDSSGAEVWLGVNTASNGDVTLYTNTKLAIKVIII